MKVKQYGKRKKEPHCPKSVDTLSSKSSSASAVHSHSPAASTNTTNPSTNSCSSSSRSGSLASSDIPTTPRVTAPFAQSHLLLSDEETQPQLLHTSNTTVGTESTNSSATGPSALVNPVAVDSATNTTTNTTSSFQPTSKTASPPKKHHHSIHQSPKHSCQASQPSTIPSKLKVTFNLAINKVAQFKATDRPDTLADLFKKHCGIKVTGLSVPASLTLQAPRKSALSRRSLVVHPSCAIVENKEMISHDIGVEEAAAEKSVPLECLFGDESVQEECSEALVSSTPTTDTTTTTTTTTATTSTTATTKKAKKRNAKRKKHQQRAAQGASIDSNSEPEKDAGAVLKKHASSPLTDEATGDSISEQEIVEIAKRMSTLTKESMQEEFKKLFTLYNFSTHDKKAEVTGRVMRSMKTKAIYNPAVDVCKEVIPGEKQNVTLVPAASSGKNLHAPLGHLIPELSSLTPSAYPNSSALSSFSVQIPEVQMLSGEEQLYRRDSKLDVESKATLSETSKSIIPLSISSPRIELYQTYDTLCYELYIKGLTHADIRLDLSYEQPIVLFPLRKTAFKIIHDSRFEKERYNLTVGIKVSITLYKTDSRVSYPSICSLEPIEIPCKLLSSPNLNGIDVPMVGAALSDTTVGDFIDDKSDKVTNSSQSTHLGAFEQEAKVQPHIRPLRVRGLSEPLAPPSFFEPLHHSMLGIDMADSQSAPGAMDTFVQRQDLNFTRQNVPSLCGLLNEGVDCFLNTIIQCLASIPEFSAYFIEKEYLPHLNQDNPMSNSGGSMANAFADLLCNLATRSAPFVPKELKIALEKFWPCYDPYTQQDAQEFLNYILDAVHEDVNKITKKPYIELPDYDDSAPPEKVASEYWDAHAKRNDSIIVDKFQGQYKSKITCKVCGQTSVKFDPFMNLTMEIPQIKVDFSLYLSEAGKPLRLVRFSMYPTSALADVRDMVSDIYDLEQRMLEFGILRDRFEIDRFGCPSGTVQDYLPFAGESPRLILFSSIPDSRYICISQLAQCASTPFPCDRDSYSSATDSEDDYTYYEQRFGWPIVISVPDKKYSCDSLYDTIFEKLIDAGLILDTALEKMSLCNEKVFQVCTDINVDLDESTMFCLPDELMSMSLIWTGTDVRDDYLKLDVLGQLLRGHYDPPSPHSVTLNECIEEHLREEEIDEWYCGRCKEHTHGLKKLDLWKLPEILIVHLKRFVLHPRLQIWTKLESVVDFPLDQFQIGKFSVCKNEEFKSYELFSVSNHIGGTERGHYTAFCKRMGKWYQFDDEVVEAVEDHRVSSKWGYVLFFRLKQDDLSSSSSSLESVLTDTEESSDVPITSWPPEDD
ncbi:hypothetical protein BASA83_009446 [Batrachochytrium salamandrivorans]|nr:hypothetical protein BASA83_009446 [Batrachochytrium salamandrivorans]